LGYSDLPYTMRLRVTESVMISLMRPSLPHTTRYGAKLDAQSFQIGAFSDTDSPVWGRDRDNRLPDRRAYVMSHSKSCVARVGGLNFGVE